MATIPSNHADRAQLGIKVARKWQDNFSTYTTKFATPTDLLQVSQNLAEEANKSKQEDGKKRVNTAKLKNINERIDKNLAELKTAIKYVTNTTDASHYLLYGIQHVNDAYLFPRDNDSRQRALVQLMLQLNQPNDGVAQKPGLLQLWAGLASEHEAEWGTGSDINSDKSSASGNAKIAFKKCGEILKKLQAQIKIDFDANELGTTLRMFGFQQESY